MRKQSKKVLIKRGGEDVNEKRLTNQEIESILGLWLISALMIIRGTTILFTPEITIINSNLYTSMDNIFHFKIWGILFIVSAVIIIVSTVSQSIKKYYGLFVGNVFGVLVGLPFALIAFAESHMLITQITITLVAFFNFVLAVHSGVQIWRDKKKIHL